MSPARSLVVACLVVCATPAAARADEPAFLAKGPPPLRHEDVPAPAPDEDELARRPWEVAVAVGAAAPTCRGDDAASALCTSLVAGGAYAASARFRATPWVAIGLGATRASLRGETPEGDRAEGATASFGLVARAYFLDRGALDPFVESRWGVGTSELASEGPSGRRTLATAGATTGVSAGVGFWLGPSVRLGPSVAYDFVWARTARACDERGACRELGASGGGPNGVVTLLVGVDVAIGRAM